MERHRIIAHIWMWGLIFAGSALAFYFLPAVSVFTSEEKNYLVPASIPLFVIFIYYLSSIVYYRTKFPLSSSGMEDMIRAGVYGRMSHPTCIAVGVVGWVLFLFSPDWRILASDLWLTFIVFFWIKIEESAFKNKDKLPKSPESDNIG